MAIKHVRAKLNDNSFGANIRSIGTVLEIDTDLLQQYYKVTSTPSTDIKQITTPSYREIIRQIHDHLETFKL